jgi:hypothetical protein
MIQKSRRYLELLEKTRRYLELLEKMRQKAKKNQENKGDEAWQKMRAEKKVEKQMQNQMEK